MAKRTGGTAAAEPDWRLLLAAAVIHYGTKRVVGPYVLTIPKRAIAAASAEGTLAETELPNGDRLVRYTPPRETPVPKPKR
jgi:hypothetical protein